MCSAMASHQGDSPPPHADSVQEMWETINITSAKTSELQPDSNQSIEKNQISLDQMKQKEDHLEAGLVEDNGQMKLRGKRKVRTLKADIINACTKLNISQVRTKNIKVKKSHHKDAHTCISCNKSFKSKTALDNHVFKSHRVRGDISKTAWKSLPCDTCGKMFSSRASLRIHCSMHTGDQQVLCTICGKVCNNRSALRNHTLTHNEKRPFECEICGKGFIQRIQLQNHQMTHTGEKPHLCSVCGNSYRQQYDLVRHMRLHTGEKPYACPHCPKRFNMKNILEAHVRIHSGEKPYVCTQCGKSFRVKRTLERHMLIHSADRPFKCPQCGKAFKRKEHMTQHYRTHRNSNKQAANTEALNSGQGPMSTLESITLATLQNIAQSPVESVEEKSTLKHCYIPQQQDDMRTSLLQGTQNPTSDDLQVHTNFQGHTGQDAYFLVNETQLVPIPGVMDYRQYSDLYQSQMQGSFEGQTITGSDPQAMMQPTFIPQETQTITPAPDNPEKDLSSTLNTSHSAYAKMYMDQAQNENEKDQTFKRLENTEISPGNLPLGKTEPSEGTDNDRDYICDSDESDCQEKPSCTQKKKIFSKKIFPCLDCDKVFKKAGFLARHQLLSHGKKESTKETAVKEETHSEPSSDHEEESTYHCEQCGRVFHKMYQLVQHIQCSHKNLKTFECERCREMFARKDDLKKHQKCNTSQPTAASPDQLWMSPEMQPIISLSPTDEDDSAFFKLVDTQLNVTEDLKPELKNELPPNQNNDNERRIGKNPTHENTEADAGYPDFEDEDRGLANEGNSTESENDARTNNNQANSLNIIQNTTDQAENKDSIKIETGDHTSVLCDKEYKPRRSMRKKVSRKKSLHCSACGKVFKKAGFLARHMAQAHSEKKPEECVDSKDVLQNIIKETVINEHFDVLEDQCKTQEQFRCGDCGSVFDTSYHLTRHAQCKHADVKPYKCDWCSMGFFRKDHLKKHKKQKACLSEEQKELYEEAEVKKDMNMEKSGEGFRCKLCDKWFVSLSGYKYHNSRVHLQNSAVLCSVCGKSLSCKASLYSHMMIHKEERRFECPVCNLKFRQKSHLQKHSLNHTGERPYLCTVCAKSFKQSIDLQRHMRTHSGERPYKCDICSKTFAIEHCLKSHSRIHTGEKPYTCNICGLTFRVKVTLNRHMLTHSDSRPYQCNGCGQCFRRRDHLQQHWRSHGNSCSKYSGSSQSAPNFNDSTVIQPEAVEINPVDINLHTLQNATGFANDGSEMITNTMHMPIMETNSQSNMLLPLHTNIMSL